MRSACGIHFIPVPARDSLMTWLIYVWTAQQSDGYEKEIDIFAGRNRERREYKSY
jgi:hypothetical protein